MKENKKFKKRMYFFVPYNISEIQKGIQAGHAVEQYALKYFNTEEYQDYVKNDKTWIILNGGTTNSKNKHLGSLNEIEKKLKKNNIDYAFFKEPDLNNALTAVCFLADERVWDWQTYPNKIVWDSEKLLHENYNEEWKDMFDYNSYEEFIGDEKILVLKNLIEFAKLA